MEGLLNQTVTVYRQSSLDKYGKATYGSGTAYRVRVELKERRRLMPNGEVLVTHGKVYFKSNAVIDTDDRLTYDSVNYRVTSVNKAVGAGGSVHHLTAEIAKNDS